MKTSITCFIVLVNHLCHTCLADLGLPRKGKLLFEDRFETPLNSSKWTIKEKFHGAFSIREGMLVGRELPDAGHGSVIRAPFTSSEFVVEFDFVFKGGRQFNFVLDDMNCKEVHSGHIARVVFNRRGVTVQDDKSGVMNLKLRSQFRQGTRWSEKIQPLLDSKKRFVSHRFKEGKLYHAVITKSGDLLRCVVGDVSIELQSEGIAHPRLTQFGPTITGGEIHFDNFTLWSLNP